MREQRINLNPRTPSEAVDRGIQILQDAVKLAGADWCGIQNTIEPLVSILKVTSRETGATVEIKFNPRSFRFEPLVIAIKEQILESNLASASRRVSIKASVLRDLYRRATELAADLNQLLGGKNGKANA